MRNEIWHISKLQTHIHAKLFTPSESGHLWVPFLLEQCNISILTFAMCMQFCEVVADKVLFRPGEKIYNFLELLSRQINCSKFVVTLWCNILTKGITDSLSDFVYSIGQN